ncbi:MAG: SDR family oxidoreductase [Deltaproteobacteria bacterium]|nr:SDR family oxidoreductase [Deltaproteobacteria bacterium]
MQTERRTALVTGGSGGIGLETVRGLAARGYRVIFTGRNLERLASAKADVEGSVQRAELVSVAADFSSLDQVRVLAAKVRELAPRLDVLVHNAGVWHQQRRVSKDGIEDTFAVNHLAPFLLTRELEGLLRASAARVVVVSSRLHERQRRFDFDDLERRGRYRGLYAYGQSKLANVLFSNELARRLASAGVTSNALHPGDVVTSIVRDSAWLSLGIRVASPFLKTPRQGAETSLHCATSRALAGVTGRYFKRSREARPAAAALDEGVARRLWQLSESMVGV